MWRINGLPRTTGRAHIQAIDGFRISFLLVEAINYTPLMSCRIKELPMANLPLLKWFLRVQALVPSKNRTIVSSQTLLRI